jgi:hypothetical protein
MKICIIGNSHVAALKLAWVNHFDKRCKKDNDITFFASPGNSLRSLKLENNKLIPDSEQLKKNLRATSGGKSFIELASYDVFLLYGLATQPYYNHGLFYSKALMDDWLAEYRAASLPIKILEMMPAGLCKKIYLGHNPMPSEILESKANLVDCKSYAYELGLSFINKTVFNLYAAELLPQPPSTIAASGRNTIFEYNKGSRRLEMGNTRSNRLYPTGDRLHMNDKFGKIWLEEFFKYIRKG